MNRASVPSVFSLHSVLDYNPETGVFLWKYRAESMFDSKRIFASWNARFAGKEALIANSNGYKSGAVFGKMLYAHRVAWAMHYGEWPDLEIDHVNCDKSDNRVANLRQADRCENNHNIRKSSRNTSGIKGVRWLKSRNKWVAAITYRGIRVHLGLFLTSEDASIAYKNAAANLHKEFARVE